MEKITAEEELIKEFQKQMNTVENLTRFNKDFKAGYDTAFQDAIIILNDSIKEKKCIKCHYNKPKKYVICKKCIRNFSDYWLTKD